jgi:hypothetical protein
MKHVRGDKRPFRRRLDDCLNKGNLTVADLARWLERPDSTVRTWMITGTFRGPPDDVLHVMNRLRQLEKLIVEQEAFPVPVGLSRPERGKHLDWAKKNGTG